MKVNAGFTALNCRGTLIDTTPGHLLRIFLLGDWCGAVTLGAAQFLKRWIGPQLYCEPLQAKKFPGTLPANPRRVIGVGRSVVKVDSLFPGNVCMDALEIKFSVNSALPEEIMSWGDESVSFWQIVDVTRFGIFKHVRSYVLAQFVVTSFTSARS